MSAPLVVFGISPFSDMVCALFAAAGRKVVARTAHARFVPKERRDGPAFVSFEDVAIRFDPQRHEIFVALEHARQNAARAEIVAEAQSAGYQLASYVSPHAQLDSDVSIGRHVLILHGVTVQYRAHVGNNVLLGARSHVGHQAEIGNDVYFGSGVFVDRHARIGRNTVLESQVRVGESVQVAAWTYLKAFEVVTESSTDPAYVHGTLRSPARIVDRR